MKNFPLIATLLFFGTCSSAMAFDEVAARKLRVELVEVTYGVSQLKLGLKHESVGVACVGVGHMNGAVRLILKSANSLPSGALGDDSKTGEIVLKLVGIQAEGATLEHACLKKDNAEILEFLGYGKPDRILSNVERIQEIAR